MKNSYLAKVPMKLPLRKWQVSRLLRPKVWPGSATPFWFKSGRLALYYALRHIRDSAGSGTVLLPAYHCDSMVDACSWSGLHPRFFAMNEDLTPDLNSLKGALDPDVRAVVMVYFFGFPTISDAVIDILRDKRIPIVEDAAHIDLLDQPWPNSVGHIGEWIIGSPRKFYPIYDGGCAFKLNGSTEVIARRRAATLPDELRSMSFLASQYRSQRQQAKILRLDNASNSTIYQNAAEIRRGPHNSADTVPYFDNRFERTIHDAMTRVSRLVIAGSAHVDRARIRRRHFNMIWRHLEGASKCRPLFPKISDNSIVPYVFPLLLGDPSADHSRLRALGIEVLRWESSHTDICKISNDFMLRLVQIPCHEGLTSRQSEFLLDCLTRILR